MLTYHIWCPIYEMSITIRCLLKWDDFTTVKKKFGGHILFVISVFSINLHNSVLSTHKATQDSLPGYQQRNNEGRKYYLTRSPIWVGLGPFLVWISNFCNTLSICKCHFDLAFCIPAGTRALNSTAFISKPRNEACWPQSSTLRY